MRVFLVSFAVLAFGITTAIIAAPRSGSGSPGTTERPASTATPAAQPPAKLAAVRATTAAEIARAADDVPPPLTRRSPARVKVELETSEVIAKLQDGSTYAYWTFGGTIPGPFVRVRVGDTVELHLRNAKGSVMTHSIDLHAVTGPGGGAGVTQVAPSGDASFTFKAMNPGLYVYHCATAPIPVHVANGMYGLILVEPAGGLPQVDREFYVMQGELYTTGAMGTAGHHEFATDKMMSEDPSFVVFNGRVGGIAGNRGLQAKVGEKVRIFFGVGGFLPSSFHVIGEIFDRVYPEGAVGTEPQSNVQTTLVPAGGAVMVEFTVDVPGTYVLVDHTLPRALNKGAAGHLVVEGAAQPDIFSGDTSAAH